MKIHKLFAKDYETLESLFTVATKLAQEGSCMVVVFIHNMKDIKQLPEHETIYLDCDGNQCEEHKEWEDCKHNIIYHNTWSEQLQLGENYNISTFYYSDVGNIESFADQCCAKLFVESLYEDGKTPSERFGITHEQLSTLEEHLFAEDELDDECGGWENR